MTRLSKNNQGFTVIELVIVIVVIVVLAFLVFSTYAGIQQKSRNNIRQNDLKSMQESIESFYSQNGYFPNLNDLNDSAWVAKHMRNWSNSNMVDPLSKCTPSSQSCLGGSDVGVKDQYEYYATASDGTTSCNGKVGSTADQNCADYKLIATYEGSYNGSHTDVLENIN